MKRIDLHIHTTLSDGTLTPKQVIDEAAKNGVSTIAIADHDTIEAYKPELYEYAEKNDIKIIKAVEISTKIDKCGIHVLGYNIDIDNEKLNQKLFALRNARHIYLHDVSNKLQELGYIVNEQELDKIDSVTKAHISEDITNNEKNREILIKNFGHIPNKGEFIETVMNEGCPASVIKKSITPGEAPELIRQAGGKAILAHPVAYRYEDNLNENDILKIIKEMKADGIEANYIYVDRNNNKIDEIESWNKFANENNLITTIGSDFHNKDGIRPEIGLINENLYIDEDTINDIIDKLNK